MTRRYTVGIEEELATWINVQDAWRRHAIELLCDKSVLLDDAAEALVRLAISPTTQPTTRIGPDDLPGRTGASPQVSISSISGLTGINRLASDQELSFASRGITVVYGDNASGKSGYARVLRNAVGARVESELLPNVYQDSPSSSQSAIIRYLVEGETPAEWKLGEPADYRLQEVHFHDEHCADVYISTASEISYRPSALQIMDDLIAVCERVAEELRRRASKLDEQQLKLHGLSETSTSQRFVRSLSSSTTEDEIDQACSLPDGHDIELARLQQEEARLKSSDPAIEKERLLRFATAAGQLSTHLSQVHELLGDSGAKRLRAQVAEARAARQAATAASMSTFENEPLSGVGDETWRRLWEAAKRYAEREMHPGHQFPQVGHDARCALCQQTLTGDAGARMQRFAAFMTDTTEAKAAAAESEVNQSLRRIQELPVRSSAVQRLLERLREWDEELAEDVESWLTDADQTSAGVGVWLTERQGEGPEPVRRYPLEPLQRLDAELTRQANALDSETYRQTLATTSAQLAELRDLDTLAESAQLLKDEVKRLRELGELRAALKLTDTKTITRETTRLTKLYVTRHVSDHFTRETERLNLSSVVLDPQDGRKGSLRHRPSLLGASSDAHVRDVLSEGEQTALGLAGLLTEAEFSQSKCPIVFDDPVTSLDHTRRSLVAERLAQLAGDRQVIVFTHSISFFGELTAAAAEEGTHLEERWIFRRGEHTGYCESVMPWKVKSVEDGLQSLEEQATQLDRQKSVLNPDEYAMQFGNLAGLLSQLWERSARNNLVFKVFDRGTSELRPNLFRVLSKVTDEDNSEFQTGYKKASKWATRHDKDDDLNYVAPEIPDLRDEIAKLRTWHKRIKKYANQD